MLKIETHKFNKNLKMGCYEDDSNRSKISKLLRFYSTKSQDKLLNELQIRCVMHVMGKQANSRIGLQNTTQIAQLMYKDAKVQDEMLPEWSKLAVAKEKAASTSDNAMPAGRILEILGDGKIKWEGAKM